MKLSACVVAFSAFAALFLGTGIASATPASVQRDGGPCYTHEFGMPSSDGTLYCSAETETWKSQAVARAPKVELGTPCPQLGARAYVKRTDGVATCHQSPRGLRWRW